MYRSHIELVCQCIWDSDCGINYSRTTTVLITSWWQVDTLTYWHGVNKCMRGCGHLNPIKLGQSTGHMLEDNCTSYNDNRCYCTLYNVQRRKCIVYWPFVRSHTQMYHVQSHLSLYSEYKGLTSYSKRVPHVYSSCHVLYYYYLLIKYYVNIYMCVYTYTYVCVRYTLCFVQLYIYKNMYNEFIYTI